MIVVVARTAMVRAVVAMQALVAVAVGDGVLLVVVVVVVAAVAIWVAAS